jgi:hypothetical protein
MGCYFIVSSLPSLEFGSKPDISSEQLFSLFDLNLDKKGEEMIKSMRLWIDLSNIQRLLTNKEFDQRGSLVRVALENLLEEAYGLPEYVFEFFATFETDDLRKWNFPWLIAKYFEEEEQKWNGTMGKFIRFEHEWRVLLTAYRAKRMGRNIQKELRFENEANLMVRTALLQSEGSGRFIFPYEYQDLEKELLSVGPNPLKQNEIIAKYRYNFYTEYTHEDPFSATSVVAYMMRLWILEEYFALRQEMGEQILNNLMERENES